MSSYDKLKEASKVAKKYMSLLVDNGDIKQCERFRSLFDAKYERALKDLTTDFSGWSKKVNVRANQWVRAIKKKHELLTGSLNTEASRFFSKPSIETIQNFAKLGPWRQRLLINYYRQMNDVPHTSKTVLGDSDITYGSVLKRLHTTPRLALHVLLTNLGEKYSSNPRETCVILARGRYETVDGDHMYYNITIRRANFYTGLTKDDYLQLIACTKGSITGESSEGIFYLCGVDDAVVLHGVDANINDLPNYGRRILNKILQDLDKLEENNETGFCLFDFVVNTVSKHMQFDNLTFKTQLENLEIDFMKLSNNDIIKWRNQYAPCVSLYALDIMTNKIVHSPAPSSKHQFSLCWISHDKHCYPVTDRSTMSRMSHDKDVRLFRNEYDVSYDAGCNFIGVNSINIFAVGSNEGYERGLINFDIKPCILQCDSSKIYDAAEKTMKWTGKAITSFKFSNSQLVSFIHPVTGQILMTNDDLQTRTCVLTRLREDFNTVHFQFRNQSMTTIAVHLMEQLIGKMAYSTYTNEVRDAFDAHHSSAIVQTLTGDTVEGIMGYDIIKSYSNILMKARYYLQEVPVFTIHDVIEPYDNKKIKCGKYYLDDVKLPYGYGDERLIIKKGWHAHYLIMFLLDNHYITKEDIKYQCRAHEFTNCRGELDEYVEYVYKTFSPDTAKKLVNFLVGYFNTKYRKTNYAAISCDDDTTFYLALQHFGDGKNKYEVNRVGKYYLISKRVKERTLYDCCPLWDCIIAWGNIALIKLIKSVWKEGTQLVAVNTDSCFVTNGVKIHTVDRKMITQENILQHLGAYAEEEYLASHLRIHVPMSEIMEEEGYKYVERKSERQGVLTIGGAGSGKTYTLAQDIISHKGNFLCLSFTNRAVKQVKQTLKKLGATEKMISRVKTFDKLFNICGCSETQMIKILSKSKTVYVDEFSMVPNKYMTYLYHSNACVKLFGDNNQLSSIEDEYDYTTSAGVKEMCPTRVELTYRAGCMRFDDALLQLSQRFLTDGTLRNSDLRPIDETLYRNICYTNKKRVKVNTVCCERFIKEHPNEKVHEVEFYLFEKYRIIRGMPLIADVNIKYADIVNSENYTLTDISDDGTLFTINHHYMVKNVDTVFSCPLEVFTHSFLPAFCVTVHKYQGSEIDEPYNIYEVEKMHKKLVYTALTRATKHEYIHADIGCFCYCYQPLRDVRYQVYGKMHTKYYMGKLYQVAFNDGTYYVGVTCKQLPDRMAKHLEDKRSVVFKNKDKEPQMSLIYYCPVETRNELLAEERKEIRRYVVKYGVDKIRNIQKKEKPKEEKAITAPIKKGAVIDKLKKIKNIKINDLGDRYAIRKTVSGRLYSKILRYHPDNKKEVYRVMCEFRDALMNKYISLPKVQEQSTKLNL